MLVMSQLVHWNKTIDAVFHQVVGRLEHWLKHNHTNTKGSPTKNLRRDAYDIKIILYLIFLLDSYQLNTFVLESYQLEIFSWMSIRAPWTSDYIVNNR